MSNDKKQTVYQVTNRILNRLDSMRSTSSGKGLLSNLRRSTGRPLSEVIVALPMILEEIPEEMLGKSDQLNYAERAIFTCLQIYASHQQGKSESVNDNSKEKYMNFGESLRSIRKGEDTAALDRRFNAMITASTFDAFAYYLRQLVQIMKSKSSLTKVNYALLAQDLFTFQLGFSESVRLRWARSYYWKESYITEEQKTVANQ